jgi:hypothetical protein
MIERRLALVAALQEIGELYFSIGNLASATEMWNDSLDTIF